MLLWEGERWDCDEAMRRWYRTVRMPTGPRTDCGEDQLDDPRRLLGSSPRQGVSPLLLLLLLLLHSASSWERTALRTYVILPIPYCCFVVVDAIRQETMLRILNKPCTHTHTHKVPGPHNYGLCRVLFNKFYRTTDISRRTMRTSLLLLLVGKGKRRGHNTYVGYDRACRPAALYFNLIGAAASCLIPAWCSTRCCRIWNAFSKGVAALY